MLARVDEPAIEVVSLGELRQRLDDEIYEKTNGVVQAGPFKGMQLYPDRGWPESSLSAELLGFFEAELHEDVEQEIARLEKLPVQRIANVGCAEGYYAVGLGKRLPKATVYVIEPDERSLHIARKNAENNSVWLVTAPEEDAFHVVDLIVMDCEGAELDYLDPVKHPSLTKATIIVELHPPRGGPDPAAILRERFIETHNGKIIVEGGRNPNASPLLWGKTSLERWLAVCESRPCIMTWAVLRPKDGR